MYTVEDLRREMADETCDLAPQVTFEQIRTRAARRRLRTVTGAIAAALVPVFVAGTFVALQPAGSSPSPMPTGLGATTVVPVVPNRSVGPPSGPVISTGLPVGDAEQLVLFYRDAMNGVQAGLSDPNTGQLRELDGGATVQPGAFGTVFEVDDRRGGIIDYGVFGRADARIEVTIGGKSLPASTGRLPQVPDATLFWVKRDGVRVAPTGATDAPTPDAVFTARDAAGSTLGTATYIQRSDGTLNRADSAAAIGDSMHTGLTLAAGGELVFWFDGDENSAILHAGSDDGAGTTKELKALGSYHRPPFAIGFYGGLNTFELAGGMSVAVGTYVGPAATVTMQGTNATRQGSARWSAHPETRIFWAIGVTGPPTGVAQDAQGNVLGATNFSKPGGG
jgi:hypothetical protein